MPFLYESLQHETYVSHHGTNQYTRMMTYKVLDQGLDVFQHIGSHVNCFGSVIYDKSVLK